MAESEDWISRLHNVLDLFAFCFVSHRVFRGGYWFHYARHCRSASRLGYLPDFRYYGVGFRVVLAQGQP